MLIRRVKSVLFVFITMCMPLAAQGPAEVWLNKASALFQQKGVEIVFRINEEGVRIGGKLLMCENRFLFDTDEMKVWYDGTTQWTLQTDGDYNELYIIMHFLLLCIFRFSYCLEHRTLYLSLYPL